MMMVSSAKLQKSQRIILSLSPYQKKLQHMMQLFLSHDERGKDERRKNELIGKGINSPFTVMRTVKRVAIIAFSSNSGLAGRFNDNIIEKLREVVKGYMHLGKENILIYPIGEKVAKAVRGMGFEPQGDYNEISGKPEYIHSQLMADKLMEMFLNGTVDRAELIYHHYRSKGSQVVIHEPFLPLELKADMIDTEAPAYIIEPDRETIMQELIPKSLKVKLFATHLDSVTSEHAARMTAMQIATDNADDLSEELTMEYNKLRQESITNELLDIVGGSFGRYG